MRKRIYAVYRGDEYRGEGTIEEIAVREGVSRVMAKFAATAAARRREEKRKGNRSKGALILVYMGKEGDEE